MEDNIRNALIILSGVVIAAIFIHGLWTIRKQKNPYKLKASKDKVKPLSRDFDGKGFDQDGVGQVKILKQTNEPEVSSEQDFEQPISLDEISHLDGGQSDEVYSELTSQEQVSEHDVELGASASQVKPTVVTDAREEIILEKPIYQQPVTQAKPETKKVVNKKPKIKAEIKRVTTKRPQMEINFGDGLALDDSSTPNIDIDESKEKIAQQKEQVTENKKIDNSALESQIIILSVVMPAHQQMSGAALLPSFLTLGMKYGEMNIFHRHQDNAGNGAVTFSLANMLNPGSFDLDTMETFVTQGVSLFMTLPNASDPFAAFEQMLSAAKQLAAEFKAQLVDDKRNIMTKQTEQHYVSKIREFDRQYRLASVE
ncbi:cell division protein ZipA [Candidatus Colwellia aromaticivorans]|uniref:cell division protein ZipA n=1 Tax=Candidatus Colwellia aromaticivorans TaxID=2267621 RepID=UPI000DF3A9D2|nr:cell division protein ZipA [Candidatus Colwellia aromaticivorans]